MGIYQKLPNSKYNQILQLSLHKNVHSKLYYDGIGYFTSLQDSKKALSTLLGGFSSSEFDQAISGIKHDQDSLKWDHKKRIEDDIHQLAFQKSKFHNIDNVTVEQVQSYANEFLFSDDAVVSAVGHDLSLNALPKGKNIDLSTIPRYFGGYRQIRTEKPPMLSPLSELDLNYFGIYFPVSSICSNEMFTFAVLCQILGGGSAFSAGGPGKGIYSRLYDVLCRTRGVESIFVNLYQYEHISLFGITLGGEYNLNKQAFSILLNQMMRLFDVDDVELERAKFQTLSNQFQALEKTEEMVEYLGRSIQTCGKAYSTEEIEAGVMAVNKTKIQDCISTLLKAPPTCCVVGSNLNVEDPQQLCQRLGIPTVN